MKKEDRIYYVQMLEDKFRALYELGSEISQDNIDAGRHIMYALDQIDSALNNLKYAKDNENDEKL